MASLWWPYTLAYSYFSLSHPKLLKISGSSLTLRGTKDLSLGESNPDPIQMRLSADAVGSQAYDQIYTTKLT